MFEDRLLDYNVASSASGRLLLLLSDKQRVASHTPRERGKAPKTLAWGSRRCLACYCPIGAGFTRFSTSAPLVGRLSLLQPNGISRTGVFSDSSYLFKSARCSIDVTADSMVASLDCWTPCGMALLLGVGPKELSFGYADFGTDFQISKEQHVGCI